MSLAMAYQYLNLFNLRGRHDIFKTIIDFFNSCNEFLVKYDLYIMSYKQRGGYEVIQFNQRKRHKKYFN